MIFPPDNPWNQDISARPVDPNSAALIASIGLKADYDLSGFPPVAQVILTALKRYGMLVADNGGDWFLSGAPDPRWDDEALATLKRVTGRNFEVVEMGPVATD